MQFRMRVLKKLFGAQAVRLILSDEQAGHFELLLREVKAYG